MLDVQWIKIVTDIFSDEKILLIESMQEADSIIVIWFKLLCMAGKQNNGGVLKLNDRIAYTDEMLAKIFHRDVDIVRMSLKTFEELGMIEIINDAIVIPNWSKHQSLDALEKKKERDRLYQANRRAIQKRIAEKSDDCQTIESSDIAKCSLSYSNSKSNSNSNNLDNKDSNLDNKNSKPIKHKYGEYNNVLLTDEDIEKLKKEFSSDWSERIEQLSCYIASTGKVYKNHLATLRNWARRDAENSGKKSGKSVMSKVEYDNRPQKVIDMEELKKLQDLI